MSPFRMLSNGLLLAALVLGLIVVIADDGGVPVGLAAVTPSPIAATQTAAASTTPTVQPPGPQAPARKSSRAPKHPSGRASGTPDHPQPHHARPSQKSRDTSPPRGKAPARRGGTVYLTFDDGPSQYTPAILNILRATHSTATFFELGFRQAEHPEEAAQIRAEGSSVGNHTYNHPNLTALKPGQIQWQLAHGPRARCVRPPYGATNKTVRRILSQRGLRQVLWTVDTRDWTRPGTKRIITAATGPTVRAGSIVLMHDGGGDRTQTVAALPQIIASLQHQGYVVRGIPGC
jgi:peptidoglycan/xylan/chitin deacetylase (PgdA/CDA1 family)